MEELTDIVISGIKNWLAGTEGEQWLSSLGYVKLHTSFSGSIPISFSGSLCPQCSGYHYNNYGSYCEYCGKYVCDPCLCIVDPLYNVTWCSSCVEKYGITTKLIYNE